MFYISLFLFAPFSLRRLLISHCLCVLTVPAIMLCHTHAHSHRVVSPTTHLRHREGSAWHSNSTQGNALDQHACFHHRLHSKHARARTHTLNACSLTCTGGIYPDTHGSVHRNLLVYTLSPIIRSPYLKIRGNSENKASSKAKRGWETWKEGGAGWVWWKRRGGGHPSGGEGMNEGERGERGKEACDVLRRPSWRFGSSATYLSWSVAPFYPLLTLRSPRSSLIMGPLLAESATIWQSWTHLGAYSHFCSYIEVPLIQRLQ